MTSAMDRGGGGVKVCRWIGVKKGWVCQISGKNADVFYGRSIVSIRSLKIFFVFNFFAAIEFRDLKLSFVYHLIVDIIQKSEYFCQRIAG